MARLHAVAREAGVRAVEGRLAVLECVLGLPGTLGNPEARRTDAAGRLSRALAATRARCPDGCRPVADAIIYATKLVGRDACGSPVRWDLSSALLRHVGGPQVMVG